MNSVERHEKRYQRRVAKRKLKKQQRSDALGTLPQIMSYHNLYNAGKKCCKGVRWKQSVQNFEHHLFSKTAFSTYNLKYHLWKPSKYTHFMLHERGKIRPIDAPFIKDRQVHKVYTKNVLLPLYKPDMIYNNGASLEGKGFDFSMGELKKDLRSFYRKYGREGYIILLDFKQFFPSIPHSTIFNRHNRLILDKELRVLGDSIVNSNNLDYGMPLGVEPSQAEMIAITSNLDNYIKCQLRMKYAGHYMDDYYILIPPFEDPKLLLKLIIRKAVSDGLTISRDKTRIQPISRPFKYCKTKYILKESGKVITRGNKDSIKRARVKIKAFKTKIKSYLDLWCSINGIFAYFEKYNDHNIILKLRRLFFSIYGFSSEKYENFVERENQYELHLRKTL